jgi:GntR family transcriptional regulator/MocR family aminotransferase
MELVPPLDPSSPEPLYSQLYRHIRAEIESGRLAAGVRLPSVRKLAAHLGISRTPVEAAYGQLAAEGYVRSKPRSGLTVLPFEPEFSREAELRSAKPSAASASHVSAPDAASNRSAEASSRGAVMANTNSAMSTADKAGSHTASPAPEVIRKIGLPEPIDFHYGDVDLDHFPYRLWHKLLGRCFAPDQRQLFRYGDPLGEPGFRAAVSDYAYRGRGVVCPPERIVVGAGTHHTIEQLCRLLQRTPYAADRTAIAVEESMSDGIAAIFRQYGYRLVPVRLEPDGIRIEDVYDSGALIVYTTPSHQFPYGMVLSIGKRRRLLNWAAETGGLIIEDDYDGEFRYAGMPIPSLQGLDPASGDSVIYVGTFSRALAPAFRLSYAALPPALAATAASALHPFDRLASPLHQKTLELFMAGGYLQRHIRKMRNVYQRKWAALVAEARRRLEPDFRIVGGAAGLHVLLESSGGVPEERLIGLAEQAGVRVYPTSVYRIAPERTGRHAVLLGFGGLSEDSIAEGIRRLADAWLA